MSLVIDANMKLFAERMNITSSRMIQDYGLKSVDEIIEAEAAQGNLQAVKFAQEMYNSPAKLIKIFKLTDVENKFVLLHNMNSETREKILPMLDSDDLVMGLYFFTQDKLLEMLDEDVHGDGVTYADSIYNAEDPKEKVYDLLTEITKMVFEQKLDEMKSAMNDFIETLERREFNWD